MKNVLLTALSAVLIIITTSCGPEGHIITGTKGVVKEIINGNTIMLTSGLRVQLLGVSPDHESTRVFMENNNIVGKEVKLIADKGSKKRTYRKVSETVRAYVFLMPSNECLNGLILRQCARADNTVYSEAFMTDSVENWRKLFEGCNHDGTLPDIALYMKQRTFLIVTPEGLGTGFFINENGLAITNWHVLAPEMEESARIYLYSENPDDNTPAKERKVQKILSSSPLPELDITIFTVDLLEGEKVPYFHLTKEQAPVGKHVQTLGNPGGGSTGIVYTAKYSQGAIGSYMTGEEFGRPNVQLVTFDIPANHGNSGGPIALDNGVVVAVLEMGEANSQGLNSGINILQVRPMLDALKVDYDCK